MSQTLTTGVKIASESFGQNLLNRIGHVIIAPLPSRYIQFAIHEQAALGQASNISPFDMCANQIWSLNPNSTVAAQRVPSQSCTLCLRWAASQNSSLSPNNSPKPPQSIHTKDIVCPKLGQMRRPKRLTVIVGKTWFLMHFGPTLQGSSRAKMDSKWAKNAQLGIQWTELFFGNGHFRPGFNGCI